MVGVESELFVQFLRKRRIHVCILLDLEPNENQLVEEILHNPVWKQGAPQLKKP